MATRHNTRDDVLELIWDHYCRAIKYQKLTNDITVQMTFDEYLSLWTPYRVKTIGQKIDEGPDSIKAYMTNAVRPVCTWASKNAMERGGVMTVHMAKIRGAMESKKLFQFQHGDKHTQEACARIGDAKRGKQQSPEQIRKRTATRVATMARKKALREVRI